MLINNEHLEKEYNLFLIKHQSHIQRVLDFVGITPAHHDYEGFVSEANYGLCKAFRVIREQAREGKYNSVYLIVLVRVRSYANMHVKYDDLTSVNKLSTSVNHFVESVSIIEKLCSKRNLIIFISVLLN
ncbi:hypothetical protein [Alkalicoccus daliensis]|uniref:Uncharacterized protein n=1 Tax=Alkalicoccus daliensis TaxID=745820 RepID=A0A1H0E9F1_9BACI|nr:hypothetical protein [Alkalicoccus daliensis]SDN78916.1 hypothetical protein SAMN04488053_103251 [Alkalicoccus daliensis]